MILTIVYLTHCIALCLCCICQLTVLLKFNVFRENIIFPTAVTQIVQYVAKEGTDN